MAALIGLSTYREPASWGVWAQRPTVLLATTYPDAVRRGGGIPVLLPPAAPEVSDQELGQQAQTVIAALQGLIIAGGPDVDPSRYGQPRHTATSPPRADRDSWELALLQAAFDAELPVLAICRGMQVLNVARGGTLHQHLPDVVHSDLHAPSEGAHGRHDVRLDPTSRLGSALGRSLSISTYHHQAVDRIGTGLVPTAWAADATVEAVEAVDAPWVVGVQWHPEVDDDMRLFERFAAVCAA